MDNDKQKLLAQIPAELVDAVRAQAFEEAAKACETWGEAKVAKWDGHDDALMRMSARDSAWDALQCAHAIRALAVQPSTQGESGGGK